MGQTFFGKKILKILWNGNGRKIKSTFWYRRCYYQTLRSSVLRYKDLIVSEFFFYFWYHHYKFYPKLLSYQIQLKVVYLSPKFIGVLNMYLVGKKFCLFVIYSRDLDFRGGMTLKKKTSSNLNEGSEKNDMQTNFSSEKSWKIQNFFPHCLF